ncbi:MAG TPA: class I SAM-dependent methyltransferase, partial [Planctomycetota bacterium]|nr:class I SAM-dependent methyltransferase [Planctomycetota bacterium]
MASDVPADPSVDRAAAHWSRMALAGAAGGAPVVNWLESPLVQRRYVHPAVAGVPDLNWFAWVMTRHVPRDVARACTLGCGSGGLERHARQLGCFAPFDAFDVSEASLRIA